jgi:hypothetical protein
MEQCFDFIVIPQEADEQVCWTILKDETQGNVAAAFENLTAQFADPQAAVDVWAAKGLWQFAQGEKALRSFVLGKVL